MDFGTLLHTAQKNEKSTKPQSVRYYSTKYEPPKKQQRANKQLSDNIKKFLAKQEAEKRAKQQEVDRKREELLALRSKDKKAVRRVNVMLKRTKSANQSVLEDAIDRDNTSVTLAGPAQPDEDDYGYVSQEAAAFYNKMMEKYNKMPEEPKFDNNKKRKVNVNNLNNTKDKLKAALEESYNPHKKRKIDFDNKEEEVVVKKDETTNKNKRLPPPPPLKFDELLKIAEKKQFEPIVIEQKPKEEEKLLTKKQKKEFEREREWRERREGKLPPLEPTISKPAKSNNKPIISSSNNNINKPIINNNNSNAASQKSSENINGSKTNRTFIDNKLLGNKIKPPQDVYNKKLDKVEEKRAEVPSKLPPPSKPLKESFKQPKDRPIISKKVDLKPPSKPLPTSKQLPPQLKEQQKPKQFPPRDLKPKQFPPPDLRAKKQLMQKRRIIDDEDEEYDPEMDDFIDDGPEDAEDYSKHIKEIFGYDKSKYRYVNDDDDCMESTFAQQMREEIISTKIGIKEDLEDMAREEEEKRRKVLMKKRKL